MSAALLALFLAATDAHAPAAEPEAIETFVYTVKEGESCAAIAKRHFGNAKRYDIIHRYNPGMGPTPHTLVAGSILILPRTAAAGPQGPDAEVTASRRRVEARAAEEAAWRLASIGLDLFRGWRVNTLARASAELTFKDASVLELRENTLVIIYGATGASARRTTTEATLDRGALRSRLGELAGGATLKVETPAAAAELEGGRALITVDPVGTSRLANHGAGKASVRGKVKKKRVTVAGGMGSKVEPGKAATPPLPLPPAPRWAADQTTRFVAIPAGGATVTAAWQAEPKAASYRVEIARKPDGRDVVADAIAPGDVVRVEIRGLPVGEYWMSVASIDADAFESAPGELLAVRVAEGALVLPDGVALAVPQTPDGDEPPPPAPVIEVPAGTRFVGPAGMQCTAGDGPAGPELVLGDPGAVEVRCTDADGAAARLNLTVSPGSDPAPAPVTTPIAASPPQPRRDRGELRWIERWSPERNMWELGIYGGIIVPSRNLELFEADLTLPEQGFKTLRRVAPEIGLRAAWFPLRVFGLEIEGGAMPTRTRSDDRATLFTARGHVIGRLGFASVTPFLLAGAGLVGVNSERAAVGRDVDAALHFGGGLELFMHRHVAMRLDIRDVITAKRGVRNGVTHSPEVLLGVSFTLGRSKALSPVVPTTPPPSATTPESFPSSTTAVAPVTAAPPSADPVADPNADADADGVPDPVDRCPDAAETKNGFDDDDGCPDALPAAPADFDGVLEGIAFATGSAAITPASAPKIDAAIALLRRFPTARVMIIGHTDAVGDRAANVALSARRAEAVRAAMIAAGIEGARLQTRGAGPDEPIASNADAAGRAKNRRIELELVR